MNYASDTMPARPQFSVVIPTYNRRERLARALGALAKQSVAAARFEVVVVDDGSSDGTPAMLASQVMPYSVRVFRQANAGPARARNRAVEEARGDLVLFLDDDIEPTEHLIAEHARTHEAEPEDVAVIGPLASLPHYDQPWVAWEQAKLEAQYRAMLRGDYAPTFRQFWTGNASVRRTRVLEVGGFNPALLRGEDVDLAGRMGARGLQFRFNPSAIGVHHAERSLRAWTHAQSSYGRVEVDVFGRLGEAELREVLAGNYSRLHRATRSVLSVCLGHPALHRQAVRALEAWIQSGPALSLPKLSQMSCSLLANLLYWRASAEALGARRIASVIARANELVEHRNLQRG